MNLLMRYFTVLKSIFACTNIRVIEITEQMQFIAIIMYHNLRLVIQAMHHFFTECATQHVHPSLIETSSQQNMCLTY